MRSSLTRIIECIGACSPALLIAFALHSAAAQESKNLSYLNPQLSPEQRATDLVRRMTPAENATQMQNNSAAVVDGQHAPPE